ncbi:hypothetical protein BDV39DRAFT_162483 [Aspergillus sergii]|uniref:Uncharacterized protein n=1 Tax=Aspergillus sergii TaxID=1034303 RepID=A0A5N6WM51_9EURO|nr:hypothetical protein BDV39DRAFT_162483 [Aspergillus sergii]
MPILFPFLSFPFFFGLILFPVTYTYALSFSHFFYFTTRFVLFSLVEMQDMQNAYAAEVIDAFHSESLLKASTTSYMSGL